MALQEQAPLSAGADRRQRPTERRRSVRAECQVPVVVRWVGSDGSHKQEATETRIVNAHGCMLLLKASLMVNTPVEITNSDTREARKGHVAWSGSVGADGRNKVAVELEDPDPKFWGPRYVDFLLWAILHSDQLKPAKPET
ncbi:MAG: hypothetical protein ACE5G6_07605 [Terriglobia bacterium]